MLTLLTLGFLLGIRHAVEADHAAAVASLALRSRSVSHTVLQGLAWGIGHTLTLVLFSSIVLLLGAMIPERLAESLEFAVGIMLVGLGLDIFRKLWKHHIHFHTHEHPGTPPHVHAHSHQPVKGNPDPASHDHPHSRDFPIRALLVGLMHGMAGSAALIILTLQTVATPMEGIAYILLFGLGSTLGMALFSFIMALPLWYSARSLTHWHNGIQFGVALFTTGLGLLLLYEHAGWLTG
jgi:ABC-type nickel/cobalt efflux system permease component RcnA